MSLLKPNVTSTWAWAKVFNYLVPICIEIKYYQSKGKMYPYLSATAVKYQ